MPSSVPCDTPEPGDTWSVRARFSTGRARFSGGFRLACGLKSARETFVARKPRTTPMDTRNKSHPRPKLSRLAVYRGAHTVIHRLACAWWSESAPSARWLVPKGVLGGSSGSPETPPARPGLLVLSQMQRTRPLSPPVPWPPGGEGGTHLGPVRSMGTVSTPRWQRQHAPRPPARAPGDATQYEGGPARTSLLARSR